MFKIKTRAIILKDPARFHSCKTGDKFEDIIEPQKILEEKSFQFPKQLSGMMNNIYTAVARREWLEFCAHPQDLVVLTIKELFSNMLQRDQRNIFVRQVQIPLDSWVINTFCDFPAVIDCEYTKFAEYMTVKKWGEVFKTLTIKDSEWINEENRVVNRIDLKLIAKVWVKFLKSRLMSTTHTITVSQNA